MALWRHTFLRPAPADGSPPSALPAKGGGLAPLACVLLLLAACGAGATGERRAGPSSSPSPSASVPEADRPRPSAGATPSGGPSDGGAFRVAVKGDWGAGTTEQAAVSAQMCIRRAEEPFADVITTGDNFYKPDGHATERNYHLPEACLTGHPGHRWRAVWGNHDVRGDSTLKVLGAERHYTWSSGPVQFFMLDSNRPNSSQTAWLERELTASRAGLKVAVFHHPPFTTGTHEDDLPVRRYWVPLFERHGVSLVLSGHNHLYEHSEVNGVHYVVTGGGGAGLYRCERPAEWLRKCEPRHHFLLVRGGESTTLVRAIDISGETVDQFELRNRLP